VIHLAGRAHLLRDVDPDPLGAYRRAHVDSTRVLLAAAARAGGGAARVVLVSTVAAAASYTREPIDDDVVPAPASPYGVSKREMEVLAGEAGRRVGVEVVTLRPPMVYGPAMKGNPLRLMAHLARGRPVPVTEPPARRSSLYVGNLVAALRLALVHPALDDRPYFVSDGPAPTVPEFVRAMATALNVPARVIPIPRAILSGAGRLGDLVARLGPSLLTSDDVRRLTGSIQVDGTRFWRTVGEAPPHTMLEGLRSAAAWFRSGAASASPRGSN
jgi:UDP-glucose 4-epimerase